MAGHGLSGGPPTLGNRAKTPQKFAFGNILPKLGTLTAFLRKRKHLHKAGFLPLAVCRPQFPVAEIYIFAKIKKNSIFQTGQTRPRSVSAAGFRTKNIAQNTDLPLDNALPLVTVICVCHNQAAFVEAALRSVASQTYPHVELIVVDDGSTDGSVACIQAYLTAMPLAVFVQLDTSRGICAAFNRGLEHANGEFIIDLAADDVLLPERIERQVQAFGRLDNRYGVVFSNAEIIDERSRHVGFWHGRETERKPVPSGNIYTALLRRSFICTPTMMTRKAVYDEINGYDESLSYEDFDFWVRSARKYRYHYSDEVLTQKRRVNGSSSTKFYQRGHNPHLASTLKVCEKALCQNRFDKENQALAVCVRYHLRQAVLTENFGLAAGFARLLEKIAEPTATDRLWRRLYGIKLPLFPLYRQYLRLRHAKTVGVL